MYILLHQSDHLDFWHRVITRNEAQTDIDGFVVTFRTRAEAEAAICDTSVYEGVPPWHILEHNQISGNRPVPKWVSNDYSKWPRWAQGSGLMRGSRKVPQIVIYQEDAGDVETDDEEATHEHNQTVAPV